MNSFGDFFKISIYGESHSKGIGILIDNCPAGIKINEKDFFEDIEKRKPIGVASTKRKEEDKINIVSGVYKNHTTGAPINIFFENKNINSKDYSQFVDLPRPSHTDFVANNKYKGYNDIRGGGHFSGRLTLGLVAAGVISKKIIKKIKIESKLVEICGEKIIDEKFDLENILKKYEMQKDSVGGVIECKIKNIPIGLGEPFFGSLESKISSIIFSIPGVKGIEFGAGFSGTRLLGSEYNDCFIDETGKTKTNNSGGINGGISNGNEILLSVAMRPTSSIFKTQDTFNFKTKKMDILKIEGRHDVCFAKRVPIIIENAIAIVLADSFLMRGVSKMSLRT